MDSMQATNRVPGPGVSMESKLLETGAGAFQSFAPLNSICAHLNAFHVYADDPKRTPVETNHYCAHLSDDVRQCLLYDSPDRKARLIGIEYMVTPRLYETLPASERQYWHSHVFEVKSGMLVMPGPTLSSAYVTPSPVKVPGLESIWEQAETQEMKQVVELYGKVYHLWQTDRGDKLPLGEPKLMTSFTAHDQFGNFETLVGDRDRRLGTDWRRKKDLRRDIKEPQIHSDADQAWQRRNSITAPLPRALRVAELLKQPTKATSGASGANDHVEVNGFVRSIRKQKAVAFAAVGDGSALEAVQAVLKPEDAEQLAVGTAVKFVGQWIESKGKGQSYELRVTTATALGDHDASAYPIQKKYHSPEYLRTMPHLRARTPHNALLLRLRSFMIGRVQEFLESQDFVQTHTPLITSSDCEGAGEVFSVSPNEKESPEDGSDQRDEAFFGSTKYLTVSAQLHLEALAQAVGKVWTLSPTFRAEKSDTARHLSEFYMLEAEVCFTEQLEDIMSLVEDLVRSLATQLLQGRGTSGGDLGEELLRSRTYSERNENDVVSPDDIQHRWEGLVRPDRWPRITFNSALDILRDAGKQGKISLTAHSSLEEGLSTEQEKYLAREVGGNGPVFVTDYPKHIKPFYMASSHGNGAELGSIPTVACFDLLLPEVCEVAGGSMREHRYAALKDVMAEKGLLRSDAGSDNPDEVVQGSSSGSLNSSIDAGLDWYLDLRRYGSAPHGGFGLGFDRLLGYLTGTPNIRDVVTFPRWYGRCTC
ncbi:MAG: asparaginyl-tRNA synthetase [Chrysothrix sp. TS-e1954]|nr:MAG: asparaginyl-tRNA synthetase [Chrysothrix sp. TS-e1954]